MADPKFRKGDEVEVCFDDPGFRGAWFTGRVIRPASKRKNEILVEYDTLVEESDETKKLRESVNPVNVRPIPPRETHRSFNLNDAVDAFENDAWWEGTITRRGRGRGTSEDSSKRRFVVYFRGSREEKEFGESDLRIHRELVYGSWVPPMDDEQQQQQQQQQQDTPSEPVGMFSKGTVVEVSSDEAGFVGAWYTATVVEPIGEDKWLIEYHNLLNTDDETELLKEEVDIQHIRPTPPDIPLVDGSFRRLEEVDAFHNDGWWVGVISKVLKGPRYIVYFKDTLEEHEYDHSSVRLHQDWIDGKWCRISQALNL